MKITRNQLRKIIAESLMIEARVNLRKIGKNLEKWNGSVGNKRDKLEKDLLASLDDLSTAFDAGEFDENLKRKAAAKELKSTLEKLFQNPSRLPPEREKKEALKAIKAVEAAPEEDDSTSTTTSSASSQDKNKWNPDPNPNSGWEYQLRDCFWYARVKGKTKEYKLGKVDGTELTKASFIDSIVKLNNKYRDIVKGCSPSPVFEKPNKPNKPNKPETFDDHADKNQYFANMYEAIKSNPPNFANDRVVDGSSTLKDDLTQILYGFYTAESLAGENKDFALDTGYKTAQRLLGSMLDYLLRVKSGSQDSVVYQKYTTFFADKGQGQKSLDYVREFYEDCLFGAEMYVDSDNEKLKSLGESIKNILIEISNDGDRSKLFASEQASNPKDKTPEQASNPKDKTPEKIIEKVEQAGSSLLWLKCIPVNHKNVYIKLDSKLQPFSGPSLTITRYEPDAIDDVNSGLSEELRETYVNRFKSKKSDYRYRDAFELFEKVGGIATPNAYVRGINIYITNDGKDLYVDGPGRMNYKILGMNYTKKSLTVNGRTREYYVAGGADAELFKESLVRFNNMILGESRASLYRKRYHGRY